jgi:hypothetical protein
VLYEIVTENADCIPAWNLGANISAGSPALLEFGCDWTKQALACHPNSPEIVLKSAEILLLVQAPEEALVLLRNSSLHSPASKAALLASQLSLGQTLTSVSDPEERTVSHEFIQLYRRLLDVGAAEMVLRINDRLHILSAALPRAAESLQAAVTQANTVAAA